MNKNMKILMVLGLFVLFFNVIVVIYVLMNIFMNSNIIGIILLVVISYFQLVLNRGFTRILEVSEQFTLDSFPTKQMIIEAELGKGIITKEKADNKKHEIKNEIETLSSIAGISKIFSNINKPITIGLLVIVILLLIINGLKIFIIEDKYIMAIIIYGITSQLTICLILPIVAIPITRILRV
jgi:flagellar biosynthesis protein FlhA